MKNINQTFQYLLTIFPRFVGILSSWAIFLMIFLTTLIVFLRYFLGIGVVGLQEMVIYLHGIAFLFCSFVANIVGLVIALLYFGAVLTDWHDAIAKQHTK